MGNHEFLTFYFHYQLPCTKTREHELILVLINLYDGWQHLSTFTRDAPKRKQGNLYVRYSSSLLTLSFRMFFLSHIKYTIRPSVEKVYIVQIKIDYKFSVVISDLSLTDSNSRLSIHFIVL